MTEDIFGIKTPTEFMGEIDKLSLEKRISYLDAVVLYCEQNNIEIETAASLIKGSTKMKARIQDDAEDLNYWMLVLSSGLIILNILHFIFRVKFSIYFDKSII
jgi:hypothetical protein